ncbi:MAG: GNAT family N-acetyltransferase [Cyanobacteria bacterium J06614_10]
MSLSLPYLACLPLVEADIPAVLALDQRCLGGLWTRSGYQRELESDKSDLLVLVSALAADPIQQRIARPSEDVTDTLAAQAPTLEAPLQGSTQQASLYNISLLGVACLWAILEEAHITTLAIEPAQQGQKLGQLLLSELLLSGRQRGLTHATLEVRASNVRALQLYQKFQFKVAGERKRYYSDGENAHILWRSGLQDKQCLEQLTQYRQCSIGHLLKTEKYKFFAKST